MKHHKRATANRGHHAARRASGHRKHKPNARYVVRHVIRRRNPSGFVRELWPAYLTSLGVTGGKAVARGLIPFVFKKQPTGLMGLGTQTIVGTLAAYGVHLVWPRVGQAMLIGTFENLNESLLRTPIKVGGVARPIPFFGTALSDYREAYRLAGYTMRPSLSAYRAAAVGPSIVRTRAPISTARKLTAL